MRTTKEQKVKSEDCVCLRERVRARTPVRVRESIEHKVEAINARSFGCGA